MSPSALHFVPGGGSDGWVPAGETWTYASADSPTFTFTASGDLTSKYSAGMRVKLTQTTVKYFIVTKVAHSAGTTTITVYGGTDYTLANAAISSPYFSTHKAPAGFPLDPGKWTVEATDSSLRSQATPSASTWYNVGSVQISVPIGCWRLYYSCSPQAADSSASDWNAMSTLSTANNSESDTDMTAQIYAGNTIAVSSTVSREKTIALAAKTSYYLNLKTTSSGLDNLYLRGDVAGGYGSKTVIRAVCAYL